MNRAVFFSIFHNPSPYNRVARIVNYSLVAIILINCLAVALETVPGIYQPWSDAFKIVESFSMTVFLIEYAIRLWVCVENVRFSRPVTGRLQYMLTPFPILDALVLITYYAPFDLRFLRIFRILRVLRVLSLDNLDHSLRSLIRAMRRRRDILIISITMMIIAVYALSAALYQIEHSAQPDKFTNIPETLWWAVVTLTTIGYGDISPITPLGKFVAGTLAIFGIGIFALPTAIVTASILDAGTDQGQLNCPHCGKHIE